LLAAGGFVIAQTTPDEAARDTTTTTTTTTKTDHGTNMRLAAINTSNAAFHKLDTDDDGRISALEAAEDAKVATAFTMADKDKDGYLSKEEFQSINAARSQSADVDASSPSGDHVSDPSADQAATEPTDPGVAPASTTQPPK
jgi:hypothetical protein